MSKQEEGIQHIKQKYDDLTIQYRSLEKSNTEVFQSMAENFQNTINERNKQIQSLQKTIEDYDEKLRILASEHESKVCEYEDRLNKDSPGKRINRNDMDKMFRFKERGRGSAKNLTINKCDNSACKSVNVDLVRCCVCSSYVCEKCNNIPVNKLKPVADKCSSMYFVCKGCDNSEVLEVVCNPNEQPEVSEKIVTESALERMIIDKLQGIEDRIDQSITEKFEENYKNIDAKMNAVSESYANTIKRNLKPNEQAPNFRQILQETKNEDLVQQKEREVRSSNINYSWFAGNG